MPHPDLTQGRIVWATINDPQGGNAKRRPAVVLTADDELGPDTPIVVVGVSTQFDLAPPDHQVALSYHRHRHPVSLLKQKCWAVCTWLEIIVEKDIEEYAGVVFDRQLQEILTKVELYGGD